MYIFRLHVIKFYRIIDYILCHYLNWSHQNALVLTLLDIVQKYKSSNTYPKIPFIINDNMLSVFCYTVLAYDSKLPVYQFVYLFFGWFVAIAILLQRVILFEIYSSASWQIKYIFWMCKDPSICHLVTSMRNLFSPKRLPCFSSD